MVLGREEVKDLSYIFFVVIFLCKDYYIYIYEFIKEKVDDRMRKLIVIEVNIK